MIWKEFTFLNSKNGHSKHNFQSYCNFEGCTGWRWVVWSRCCPRIVLIPGIDDGSLDSLSLQKIASIHELPVWPFLSWFSILLQLRRVYGTALGRVITLLPSDCLDSRYWWRFAWFPFTSKNRLNPWVTSLAISRLIFNIIVTSKGLWYGAG